MDCILAGVGGQGTVLASKVIASVAMENGWQVRTAETIGMAQRGGSVVSHVRIGRNIASPLIPPGKADVIIGFEPGEAVRCLNYLKHGGAVVTSTMAVAPVSASLGGASYNGAAMLTYLRENVKNLITVDGEGVCAAAGTAKVLNMALLGAAIGANALDIKAEHILKALETSVKPQFIAMNIEAFNRGLAAAGK